MLAKGNGGVFPASLEMTDLMKALKTAVQGLPPEQMEEQMKLAVRMGMYKVMLQKKSKEFRYCGDGVKLDEKGRAIMYWLLADAKDYRVVFADLHAEDVAPDKLPAIEPAPSPTAPAAKVEPAGPAGSAGQGPSGEHRGTDGKTTDAKLGN